MENPMPDGQFDANTPQTSLEWTWRDRLLHAGSALVDLACAPFRWELRREYRPVKGSPHGKDETRARTVLKHRKPRKSEADGPAFT